jgi:uncharacterized protein YifN (PemK superfamily)
MHLASKDYIKERHIYFVNFEPIESGEFGAHHLAVVLRINKDKKAALVIPLTSAEGSRFGVDKSNKLDLGKIASLPKRLNSRSTYAVLDHARSVSFERFAPIKEGPAELDEDNFRVLMNEYLGMLLLVLNQEEQGSFLFENYERLTLKAIVNKAFKIDKLTKQDGDRKEIRRLQEEMQALYSRTIDLSKAVDLEPSVAAIVLQTIEGIELEDDQERAN